MCHHVLTNSTRISLGLFLLPGKSFNLNKSLFVTVRNLMLKMSKPLFSIILSQLNSLQLIQNAFISSLTFLMLSLIHLNILGFIALWAPLKHSELLVMSPSNFTLCMKEATVRAFMTELLITTQPNIDWIKQTSTESRPTWLSC